jgi:hypothetical protein
MKRRFEVEIVEGSVVPIFGQTLPKLRAGATAVLVVEDHDIQDKDWKVNSDNRTLRQVDVAEGVVVRLANAKRAPASYESVKRCALPTGCMFAVVIPEAPVKIEYFPGRRPRIVQGNVFLPDLETVASSLNNACTRLSEEFETERLSHTYSAFEVVYFRRENRWLPLKELV